MEVLRVGVLEARIECCESLSRSLCISAGLKPTLLTLGLSPPLSVTYGFKHMKIWTLAKDPKSDKESYASVMAKFRPKAEVADVTSAIFINSGTIVTGALDGTLLLFDVSGVKGPFGSCIQVVRAHEPGPTAPSMHNGLPQLQGVRALCIRGPDSALELCSGGSDGLVICWSIEGGQLRQLKRIQLQEVGESQPCSFRSLDASPGSITLIAGNNRCEIWEISKDIPGESLMPCAWRPLVCHFAIS